MDALRPRVGKARLIKLLRGSASRDVEKFKQDNSPLFGVLRHCSQAQVDGFLDSLIEHGLLHLADEDEYFVCTITAAGRAAWEEKQPLNVTLPGAARRRGGSSSVTEARVADEDEDDELFEELRDWRRNQASTENLPPYCILSDRTMHEIARQKPVSESELRGITGIGDAKLDKYGTAVLDIVRGEQRTQSTAPTVRVLPAPPRQISDTSMTQLTGTVAETYELLQSGHDVEDIAEQRGLQNNTVWTHIEQIIEAGLIDEIELEALIPHTLLERIEQVLSSLPVGVAFKEVWEKLGGEIDYGPIRCVAAFRNKAKEAGEIV
jgi:ATP-dependent DNA helicase RecQ